MRVDVLTLFPAAFAGPLDVSIVRRAREGGLLDLRVHDIRDHATGRHRSVDDYPFGGGPGMVMRVDVLDAALAHVQAQDERKGHVIYLSPQGARLDDRLVRELALYPRLVLVSGRYEGVDQRFIDHRVDREVSIGDYVLTGGELPAMVLIDAVVRHVPGALGDLASPEEESFASGLLEEPQYTRPAEYEGWAVPEVLLRGDHAAIEQWRREQRVAQTRAKRPDLLPPVDAFPGGRLKVGIDGVRLREIAYPADIPELLALWKATPGIDLTPSDEPAELAKLFHADPALALAAEAGGRVVGTVLGGWDGRRGHVYHLAVRPEERRRGIARALMAEIEARLAARGCIRAHLRITGGNTAAYAFYERIGWQRTEDTAWRKDLRPYPST